jgi:archaellum component FlaC
MDTETVEEVKRHFNVVAEGLRADIRVVIEGVSANTDRLERVEVRLDRVEGRLTGVEGRLTGVEGRLTGVEGRLTGVESEIGAVKSMIRPRIARSDA